MIFDNVYKYAIDKMLMHLLIIVLRKPKTYYWLLALSSPWIKLKSLFMSYRILSLYKIEHTPQVFSLENVLNDSFDSIERRIYIKDGIYINNIWFFNPEETAPVHFYNPEENQPQRFYDPSELENLDVDFVVVIPKTLGLDQQAIIRLKSLLAYYALPDKTYILNYE